MMNAARMDFRDLSTHPSTHTRTCPHAKDAGVSASQRSNFGGGRSLSSGTFCVESVTRGDASGF